jgi:hypothetical protein
MLIFLLFGIIISALSVISSITKKREYLIASFLFVFIFQAIRFNYGNDYISYREIFTDINNLNSSFFNFDTRFEIGWVILNKLFYFLGFESLIASISLFISIVYYKFITFYVSPKYYWISILLFYFDPNCLLINITAIRQSVSIALFLLSLIYFDNDKPLQSLLFLLLAPLFHATSIVIFPILLIIFLFKKYFTIGIFSKSILLFSYISLFFLTDYFKNYINIINTIFLSQNYFQYANTEENNTLSFINIAYYTFLLYILLKYSSIKLKNNNYLYFLTIIGLLFIPLALVIPLIARLSYYFLPILIVLIPKIFDYFKPALLKKPFIILIFLITSVRLIRFFMSDTYYSGFYHYHTIFDKWN